MLYRPDCINERYLEQLAEIRDLTKVDISIELGLQSVNYHSLIKINRGHTLGEYIDAVLRIKRYQIGLPSTGLHSNGFSLVRKICFDVKQMSIEDYIPSLGRPLGDELLRPTRLYPKVCLPLIDKFTIKGMVHITGGGFYDNIPRVMPGGCSVEVDTTSWPQLPVFTLLQQWGNVDWPEMYRTFNMGIGMILVVGAHEADQVLAHLAERREPAYLIGQVTQGDGQVTLRGGSFGD